MSFIAKNASLDSQQSASTTQITEIELVSISVPSGDWKIIFDGGSFEYTVQHNTGTLVGDLDAFLATEASNILSDTGFIATYVLTATGATITLEGPTSATITTENISSNVSSNVVLVRSAATGGAGQPQITEILFFQDGDAPLDNMSGIEIDANAWSGPGFGTYGTIENALDTWITQSAAGVLSSSNFVVTKVGTDTLRFVGQDNVTTGAFSVNDTSSNVSDTITTVQTAVAGGTVQQQITRIDVNAAAPPASGSFDVVIDNGSFSQSYPVTFTGNVSQDLLRWRRSYSAIIYRTFRVNVTTIAVTDSGYIRFWGVTPSISFTATIANDSSNVSPTVSNEQAASAVSEETKLGFSSNRLLFGYKTTEVDYVVLVNQKNRIEAVETDDWFGIFANEFNTDIYVTAENNSLHALNGLKVVSLTEDGTGTKIKYDLEGFGLKEFKVIEDVATIEAAIDSL
jgi:hypothetical protein